MIQLAEKLGEGSLKFNIIQPTARAEAMYQNDEAISVQEIISLGDVVENELSKNCLIKVFYTQPLCFRPLGRMFSDNGNGCCICGIKGILGVLSDGSYALCGIGANVPTLVFGDARNDNLEEVWNGSAFLQELQEGLPSRLEGICADCVMKGRCLGKCIAQNYYRSKDLWKPFWFCEESQKAGVFSQSRLTADE